MSPTIPSGAVRTPYLWYSLWHTDTVPDWLARTAVNGEVDGSSPSGGGCILLNHEAARLLSFVGKKKNHRN